jgi:O-antigen/teichoic acid export membrane protein
MLKYLKIYSWQALSILFNFAAVFVVTPFISAQPNLYGIYSLVIAAYLFLSYADFGFLGAGMKYAAECFAQEKKEEEVEIIGFTGAVFLVFSSLYALGILVISLNPALLVSGISDVVELDVARKMLIILALSCPALVIQRVIQIIFAIRLKDYKFQRILVMSNIIKLTSAFFFFANGRYMIVEYFLFSQVCVFAAVVFGLVAMKRTLQYDLLGLLKAFRFTSKMYNKTKKLAFTSIFLTFCWILYYELDTFAIAKIFGVQSVAIYAIGLTIITYFRSIFGIIFTPFIARFNHFIGAKDSVGLKLFFVKVVVLFLPITIFPVITVYLTVDNFILSWVGEQYITSISFAGILVLSYVFSFLTYPSGILILANERVKAMFFTRALKPLIFWAGVILTKDVLGLQSFAYFKLLAIFIETVVYSFIIVNFLNLRFIKLLKQLFYPLLIPLGVVILLTLAFKPYFPSSHGKMNLLLYFAAVCAINLLGFMLYYFTSQVFKEYSNKIVTSIFRRA